MLAFAIILTLVAPAAPAAAGPSTAEEPLSKLSRTLSWERLPVAGDAANLRVRVDALGKRVILEGMPSARRLAAALGRRSGSICPETELDEDRLILHCRTRRLEATVVRSGASTFVDLHELRGLPVREAADALPRVFWDPVELGLGDACPGTVPFSRGECAWAEGRREDAVREFEAATELMDTAGPAWIRLGDLASLEEDGVLAAERYQRAGTKGPWGRIATARICELFGGCLGTIREVRVFDAAGLPEPARSELILRASRALAFQEAYEIAARTLSQNPRACEAGELLCARIALAAMRSERGADARAGLGLYLGLRDRNPEPIGYELAASAARISAELGAPRFAANTLATSVELAPARLLEGHLHRAAELYLEGGDPIRASVILDFSTERLGRKVMARANWRDLAARIHDASSAPPPLPPPSDRAEVEAALDAARRAALRSQENDTSAARDSQ